MKRDNKLNNLFTSRLEKWLGWHLAAAKQQGIALRDFKPILAAFSEVERSRGKLGLMMFAKTSRANLLNYLSGNPNKVPGVRLTASGLPRFLGPELIRRVIKEDYACIRFILSLLASTRALKTKPEPDLSPIIDPLEKGASIEGYSIFASEFWRILGYTHKGVMPRSLKFKRFHFTTKSGPNGHALAQWATDLYQLPKQLIDSICVIGGEEIRNFFDVALAEGSKELIMHWCKIKSPGVFRKLTYFPDKEGKTRIIAIGDYFSQTVLKRLHLFLYRALSKIPQDCTFNQGAFLERMKGAPVFYSCDLSAATDRFPIKLISQVLKAHLPIPYVNAWEDIMVGYPFGFRSPQGKVESVSYSVGNPMGFYSSWASFALTHHYIVFYCCKMRGKSWKDLPYCLLGDDIVIGDKEVGELYLTVMARLGVKVSMSKTHISPNLYEFAKRLVHKGTEISPFPYSALKLAGRTSTALTTLLLEEEKKGWEWRDGIGEVVSDYQGRIRNLPARVRAKVKEESHLAEQIIRIIWGVLPAGEALTNLARKYAPTLNRTITDSVGTSILANVMVDFFSQSNEALLSKTGKPLGLLATEIVMHLTGSDNQNALALLKNPHLDAYGSIEQLYLNLLRKAKYVDTIGQGEWPLLLRAVTIPLSDELFVNRQTEVLRVAVSKVGKALVERLRVLESYPQLLDF